MVDLSTIHNTIINCTKCDLYLNRTNAVPGEGALDSRLLFIGEAPGKSEDLKGRPFVGRAGSVLDGILEEAGIPRNSIFITNIVKCRPPKNRVPKRIEIESCRDYLIKQIEIIDPDLIIAMGQSSIKTLTNIKTNLKEIHGKIFNFSGYDMMVTYHPAAIIYNRKLRPDMLNDLMKVQAINKV